MIITCVVCRLPLTHWGGATHICISKLTIIASDKGLSPGRCQAIIWNNAGILSIGLLGTKFSEILIEILTFSFKKMRLKVSSAKWRPFCLGLNVLRQKSSLYILTHCGPVMPYTVLPQGWQKKIPWLFPDCQHNVESLSWYIPCGYFLQYIQNHTEITSFINRCFNIVVLKKDQHKRTFSTSWKLLISCAKHYAKYENKSSLWKNLLANDDWMRT